MNHTYSALKEYRRRIAAMLEDPECTGDLLTLGVALLDFAVLRATTEKTWGHYAERAWGPSDNGHKWRVIGVLKSDIRRYDAIKDAETTGPGRACGSPMIRRQGPCGQSATIRTLITDPLTGRQQWLAACSRHREWFNERALTNRRQTPEAPDLVVPAANAGGVLSRHIKEIDWHGVWTNLDPSWTPPPEVEPETVPLRPRLRLVFSDSA